MKLISNRFILMIVWMLFFFIIYWLFCHFCIDIAHLSNEDLVWTTNMQKYSPIYFKSDQGHISIVHRINTSFHNEDNPLLIGYSNRRFVTKYHAESWQSFIVEDDVRYLSGGFGVSRKFGKDTLYVGGHLGERHINYNLPLHVQQFKIGDRTFDTCIVVDSLNSRNSTICEDVDLLMDKFVYSKDYGLIYYKLIDGEEFYRVFQ